MADRSIPLAIVFAGLAIAVGLYLGLRPRDPVAGAPAGVAPAAAPPAPAFAPPAAPVSAAPRVVDVEQVARQAAEALAYQRRALHDRCFRPAQAARPGLTMALVFDVAFDASGRQIGRGLVEQSGTSTPELTRCVGDLLAPLRIAPPGAPVQVDVPLRFP